MENKTLPYDFGSMSLEELLMDYFAAKKCAGEPEAYSGEPEAKPVANEMYEIGCQPEELLYPYPTDDMQNEWPESEAARGDDSVRVLYGELSHRLLPYIDVALNGYEENGAIYDGNIGCETIAAIAGQALESAAGHMHEIHELMHGAGHGHWCGYNILRELAEAITINEIFIVRLPNRSKLRFAL